MKKPYVAPQLEVEVYELNMSIASNCTNVVTNGPRMESIGQDGCSDYYKNYFGDDDPMPTALDYDVNFYSSDVCDCYTTGSGTFWTS